MKNLIAVFLIGISNLLSFYANAQSNKDATVKIDTLAEKILVYQLANGGWPKQLVDKSVVRYENVLTESLLGKIKATNPLHATIDNNATTREINALVKAYKTTNNSTYLKAAENGIAYLLEAQYANGGWPQYYPDKSNYRAEITYNDNAMINALNIMQNIALKANNFEVVNAKFITKAQQAVDRGLYCIVKTQVLQNNKLSIWAAQYNEITLLPAKARAFEPASLSTSESIGVVRFLMSIKNPSPDVKSAIMAAVKWFEANKITGYKFGKMDNGDRGLIVDENAIIWARFYDLTTNKPIFGDRDGSIKNNVAEISFERRNGYAWYGAWAINLLNKEYPKWLKANGS